MRDFRCETGTPVALYKKETEAGNKVYRKGTRPSVETGRRVTPHGMPKRSLIRRWVFSRPMWAPRTTAKIKRPQAFF
jgi:hypothetical protein